MQVSSHQVLCRKMAVPIRCRKLKCPGCGFIVHRRGGGGGGRGGGERPHMVHCRNCLLRTANDSTGILSQFLMEVYVNIKIMKTHKA